MTVHILLVEDEPEFVLETQQVFNELPGGVTIKVASSRGSAFDLLDREFFDLIVLDLKIPTVDGTLDADPMHGHAVFSHARRAAPGTPIFVLTGSPAEDFIPTLLKQQQQVDIWSEGRKIGTVDFLKKYQFDEFPKKLAPIVVAIEALSDVELDRGDLNLSIQDDRLIRIFAKKFGGTRCRVSQLSGGLSGAKVVRLRITDGGGARVHDAVAKLSSPSDVRDEAHRFDHLISRLDPQATPRKLATLDFGAGGLAGIFYGLADGFELSGFDLARNPTDETSRAVENVEVATARWKDGVGQSRKRIRDVRQRLVSDEVLAGLTKAFGLDWLTGFEAQEIQTRWCCIHGDLHGGNVLFALDGTVVLIDYGDVAEGPASLDPITLEMSILFHPQGGDLGGWPSLAQAESWGSIDEYIASSPVSEFVRQCRDWAERAGAGKREIAASAYAYLIRQLKYEETNKPLALALLRGVKAYYDRT